MLKCKWIGGQCGHWEIYKDGWFAASCDDGELNETIEELRR